MRKPPKGLQAPGRALWRAVHHGLPADVYLDGRDRVVLRMACEQVDDVAAVAEYLEAMGTAGPGSMGQERLNPAITELRQSRLAVAKLLGQLDLSEPEEDSESPVSRRARQAANSRWDRRDRTAEFRHLRAIDRGT